MVHEVQHRLQVYKLYTFQIEQRVVVRVLLENRSEERRAGRQDELVCLNLPGAAAEGAVKEFFVFSDFSKSDTDVAFKIIPPQTELLIGSHFPEFQKTMFLEWLWSAAFS